MDGTQAGFYYEPAAAGASEMSVQYAEAMALRYRVERRAYAVEGVRTRAATRIQKHWRAHMAIERTQAWRTELKIRAAALKVTAAARGRAGRKKYAADLAARRRLEAETAAATSTTPRST